MKRMIGMLTVILISTAAWAQEAPRNFLQVNSDFCTAGQPTLEQLAKLKADGVKAVLNLRPAAEFDATEEEARLKELGIRYYNIPVEGSAITKPQVDEFLRLTDDVQNRPMFIHCASANRVGAFWLIRRVLRDKVPMAEAQIEAEKIGLRSPALKDLAVKYIEANGGL